MSASRLDATGGRLALATRVAQRTGRVLADDGLPLPRVARATFVTTVVSVLSVSSGVGVFIASLFRDRPDEAVGGVLIVVVGVALGMRMSSSRPEGRALPALAVIGWGAQLVALLYYYFTGIAQDANAYHQLATRYATGQQRFVVPETNWGAEGIAGLLSLVYRVTGPSMLLGFVVFALLGFAGKFLVARALLASRDALGPGGEAGALFILLLPSLNFWLAAITKESVAVLGIGIVIGALIRRGRAPNLLLIAIGLSTIALVRAHVALLAAAAVVVFLSLILVLPREQGGRRALPLLGSGLLFAAALVVAAAYLGTDTTLGDFEARRLELAGLSDPGGSNITPVPITRPDQVAPAVSNVLVRPYLWEASSSTAFAQALENVVALVLVFSLITQAHRRRRNPRTGSDALRVRAIRAFGTLYTVGFVFAFSITYNLGLISRQRAQLWLPLGCLLATGFVHIQRTAPRIAVRTRRPGRTAHFGEGQPAGPRHA